MPVAASRRGTTIVGEADKAISELRDTTLSHIVANARRSDDWAANSA